MTFKTKSISVCVFFLKGLRGSFPCRDENKTSNKKPCLYTGDPFEGCVEFATPPPPPPEKILGTALETKTYSCRSVPNSTPNSRTTGIMALSTILMIPE